MESINSMSQISHISIIPFTQYLLKYQIILTENLATRVSISFTTCQAQVLATSDVLQPENCQSTVMTVSICCGTNFKSNNLISCHSQIVEMHYRAMQSEARFCQEKLRI